MNTIGLILGLLVGLWELLFPPQRVVPKYITAAVEKVLRLRGGLDKDTGRQNYRLLLRRASANDAFYSLPVSYETKAGIAGLERLENELEAALAHVGYETNVRVDAKRMVIQVDKRTVKPVLFSHSGAHILGAPLDQLICVPGLKYGDKGAMPYRLQLAGEQFSTFIVGRPGSGKSQLATALLLTLCMLNSPKKVKLHLCDIKNDYIDLQELGHLAEPIIYEYDGVLACTARLVHLMDKRQEEVRRTRDYACCSEVHVLFIDECSDVCTALGKKADDLADNILRLSQKGRALGIVVIVASQRAYDLPKPLYSKLNTRIVGATSDASDSVAASGIAGSACHKLPGKGAFEVFVNGQPERIQGFLVADNNKQGQVYLRGVVANINEFWADDDSAESPVNAQEGQQGVVTVEPEPLGEYMQVGGYSVRRAFVDWLDENYQSDWSQRYVRDQHKALFGVGLNDKAARAIIDFVGGTDVALAGIEGGTTREQACGTGAALGGTGTGTTRETVSEISAATPSDGYVGMSLDEWMR